MKYTVKQLSALAGVSIRTLRFYDEIGLLCPKRDSENNYRYYSHVELKRLQQILFFRELEFSLEEIKKMLDDKSFNEQKAMEEQKKLLELQRDRLNKLIETLSKTIKKEKGGETMHDDQLYSGLSKQQIENYKKEAKERWGDTDAYKQSVERTKNWTQKDYQRIASEQTGITQAIAALSEKGIDNLEVQEMIKKHHQFIGQFYDCSLEMYRNLGELYISDPRFTEYYEKVKPGLASFVKQAIDYYCEHTQK